MKTGSSQLRVHDELYRTNAPSSSQPYTFVRPTLDFGLRTLDLGLPAHHIGLGSIRIKLNCTQLHLIEVNQPGGYPPISSSESCRAFRVQRIPCIHNRRRAQSCPIVHGSSHDRIPLDVRCWLLDVGCWLLVVGCWLLVVGCWLLVVPCSYFRIPSSASRVYIICSHA